MASLLVEHSQLFKCSICFEFMNKPRMLPCLHSFCEDCIQEYINQRTWLETFTCPSCREECRVPLNGVQGFKHDFRLQQLQDLLKSIDRRDEVKKCDFCENLLINTECYYCKDCVKHMCGNCYGKHREKLLFFDHKINKVNLENVADKCRRHLDELIDYYCVDCERGVCVLCVMGSHENHSIINIQQSVNDDHHLATSAGEARNNDNLVVPSGEFESTKTIVGRSISGRIQQLQELLELLLKKEKMIKEHIEMSIDAVNQKSNTLIKSINDEKEHLLDELHDQYTTQLQQLNSLQSECELTIAKMKSLTTFSNDILQNNHSFSNNLMQRMNTTLTESLMLKSPIKSSVPRFVPSKSKPKVGKIVINPIRQRARNTTNPPEISSYGRETINSSSICTWCPEDKPKISFIRKFGKFGSCPGQFNSPRDISFVNDNLLAIADTNNDRIQIVNVEGCPIQVLDQGMVKPWGIGTCEGHLVAIADALDKCVKVYDINTKKMVQNFGKFLCPCGITCTPNKEFVVTDFFSSTLSVFSPSGELVRQFEIRDSNDRQTTGASRIAIDADGKYIISDISNNKVKIFSPSGELLSTYSHGQGIEANQGIIIDKYNNILVADTIHRNISLFVEGGVRFQVLADREKGLKDPMGLAIDDQGSYIAASQPRANLINIYKVIY